MRRKGKQTERAVRPVFWRAMHALKLAEIRTAYFGRWVSRKKTDWRKDWL